MNSFSRLALAGAALAGLLANASVRAESEETLVRTEQLRQLVRTGRRADWNFRLEGLVTAVLKNRQFILEDASGRFRLFNCREALPHVGDRVRVSGRITNANTRRDELRIDGGVTVERLGQTNATTVLQVPIARLSEPDIDMRTVCIRGSLIRVLRDETDPRWELLVVKDGAQTALVAFCVTGCSTPTPHRALVDAEVSVTGVCFRNVSGLRCCIGPYVELCDEHDIRVIVPSPADPFVAPPLETFGVHSAVEIAAMNRRSLVGTVAATWLPNRACMLEDDRHPVLVTFAEGFEPPPVGRRIRVCGYPGTDLYAINLGLARWRDEPGAPLPDLPTEPDSATRLFLAEGNNHVRAQMGLRGKVLTVSGKITAEPRDLLSPGRFRLSGEYGSVLLDVSTHPEAGDALMLGCQAKVSGICFYETEEWGPRTILPRLKDRLLVIRSPSDVTILAPAPWWTIKRLFIVICLLLAAVGFLAFRSRLAKRRGRLRVEERTRLAVELHDSLSQNLAAASFEIAAARSARPSDPNGAERHLDTADRMLRSSRTQLRLCLWDLRADTLEDPDFAQAVRNTVRLVAEDADVRVRIAVTRSAVDDSCAHAILSILRELVSNAVRHGGATCVRVAGAQTGGELAFSVTDNGRGFDPNRAPGARQGHFGLVGIHDRLLSLGGTFTLVAKPNRGTRAVIRFHPTRPQP